MVVGENKDEEVEVSTEPKIDRGACQDILKTFLLSFFKVLREFDLELSEVEVLNLVSLTY